MSWMLLLGSGWVAWSCSFISIPLKFGWACTLHESLFWDSPVGVGVGTSLTWQLTRLSALLPTRDYLVTSAHSTTAGPVRRHEMLTDEFILYYSSSRWNRQPHMQQFRPAIVSGVVVVLLCGFLILTCGTKLSHDLQTALGDKCLRGHSVYIMPL